MMSLERPIRVLHVLGALNQGGVETWLLNVLRHIDRERFQLDFLVHTTTPAVYDDDVRLLGSRILACPYPHQPWRYARELKRILRHRAGVGYDVVHSHVHDFSGFVLRVARQVDVPVRIAHSHLDSSHADELCGVLRRQYLRLMKRWIRIHATAGLGCSRNATAALFGAEWERDPRYQLFYCGVDLQPFERGSERQHVRDQFNIPHDDCVIGHVGRFNEQKNHRWMVGFLGEFLKANSSARLMLIGDGPLRPAIEQQFRSARLMDRVIFTGPRRDVARLMSGMDVFILPSHFEGLPIAVLEAQAAGLPCLLSATVDADATIVPSLVRRLSLSQPIADWVEAVEQLRTNSIAGPRDEARKIVSQSPFNIRVGVENLQRLYLQQLNMPIKTTSAPELIFTH